MSPIRRAPVRLAPVPMAARQRVTLGRLAVIAASGLVCLGTAARASATPSEGIHNIKHVVMIMQENRSFDSYFGTYPGANGIPAGVCVPDPLNGGCVRPFHEPNDKSIGGPHGTEAAAADIDGGKMDGFVAQAESHLGCTETGGCSKCEVGTECALEVMGYHDAREIPNYWTYAQNFVLQDNMFESAASWSLPEHLFMVSSWSARCPKEDTNPLDCVGSLSPVAPAKAWSEPIEKPPRATYAWTDITNLMAKAGVSWRYYVAEGFEPDCEDDEAITCKPVKQNSKTPGIWNALPDFTDVQQNGQLGNIQSLDNFYTAAHEQASCALPNVAWVSPSIKVSEHPPSLVSKGQSYVTTLINTIMRSPCWSSTAIFLSWDDWGGFYDHVVPPSIDEGGYGLRAPGIVISPYAKTGYIDHQQLSHDAYLKFIEDDFLGSARLNPATDGRPDPRPDVREEAAGLGNLANDFDFSQTPRPPLLLSTRPEPGPASTPPDSAPPTVVTEAATSVAQTTATVHATVDPNESEVSDCRFEYGTTLPYGSSAPCAVLPGSGGNPVAVSAALVRLHEGTTYHVRVVATNAGGTSAGADETFTTAHEELPEVGRCKLAPLEANARHGRYTTATCTTKSGTESGEYEWTPGLATAGFMSSGGASSLETVAGEKISCAASAAGGLYTGAATQTVNITFSGCTNAAMASCQSEGASTGEVALSALAGELGFIKNRLNKEGKLVLSVGLALKPAQETNVASFECGGVLGQGGAGVVVKGAAIAPITPIDKMSKTGALKYLASSGQQRTTSFEGGPTEVLLASISGGAFEQAGLTAASTITDEEPLEIKALP
jgi:phospholipase C